MKRTEAQKALDEAFADGLKLLYERLVSNLREQDDPAKAVMEFTDGIAARDDAHSRATSVIDQIFKD